MKQCFLEGPSDQVLISWGVLCVFCVCFGLMKFANFLVLVFFAFSNFQNFGDEGLYPKA